MLLADFIYGDVMAIALAIIGFLLSLQGLWLVCRALWPKRVHAAAGRCERQGVLCFLLGLLITGLALLMATVIGKSLGVPGQMMSFVILFSYLIFAGIGTAGFVTHIGRRLVSPVDAARPWRATLRGGIVLELACLIPLLGWFGILPMSFIVGCGAAALSIFGRDPRSTLASPLQPPTLPPLDIPRRSTMPSALEVPPLTPEGVM